MRGHTQEKNHFIACTVIRGLHTDLAKKFMREYTQTKDPIDVSTAQKHLSMLVTRMNMREHIVLRGLTTVSIVKSCSSAVLTK